MIARFFDFFAQQQQTQAASSSIILHNNKILYSPNQFTNGSARERIGICIVVEAIH